MKIHLLTVGHKMPAWVNSGYTEFAKRLPREFELVLKEIQPADRTRKKPAEHYMAEEAKRIRDAIPKGAFVVALDERGKQFTSREFAQKIEHWQQSHGDIVLVVGGGDGLDPNFKRECGQLMGLSKLTMPHAMVRVMLAEQVYRAYSIIQRHPYHRD